jgi:hypothetical protein
MNVTIRDFTPSERKEINTFLLNNLSQSHLNNLTIYKEEPFEKAEVFLNIWRVMSASSRFLKSTNAETLMGILLDETKKIYDAILPLFTEIKNSQVNFGKSRIKGKVIEIIIDSDCSEKINKLINIFVTLADREDVIATADAVAVRMDTPEGKELVKAINPEEFRR